MNGRARVPRKKGWIAAIQSVSKQIPNESGPQHLVVHNDCFGQAALEDHGYSVQNNLPGTDYLQGSACFADF